MSSRRLGGFEEWAEIVGGILSLFGFNEWMSNARSWARAADPRGEDMRQFVELWYDRYQLMRVTPRELATAAEGADLFPDCFTGKSEAGKVVSFARRILGSHRDTPVSRWVIRQVGSGSSSLWMLETNAM